MPLAPSRPSARIQAKVEQRARWAQARAAAEANPHLPGPLPSYRSEPLRDEAGLIRSSGKVGKRRRSR